MPGLTLWPIKGQGEAQSLRAGVLVPVGGWDKRIVPVLDHARREPLCECLCRRLEVVQHNVAAPPTHEVDCVYVNLCHEESHGAAGPHQARWRLLGMNTTWVPMIVVAARSAALILELHNVDHLTRLKTAARCVSEVAPCFRKCSTRRRMAATSHAWGCPVAPCPKFFPLTPFFAL